MTSLVVGIISQAENTTIVSPKEFLHLGSRAAIDKTFSRLVKDGKLLRIGRGLYSMPVQGRFGVCPPSSEKILESLHASGETTVSHGAAAANRLGLTTQVPVREIYLTSGRSRTLRIGKRALELQHASQRKLLLGETLGGTLLRALLWMGQEKVCKELPQLREKIRPEAWTGLASVRRFLPSWLATEVSLAVCESVSK